MHPDVKNAAFVLTVPCRRELCEAINSNKIQRENANHSFIDSHCAPRAARGRGSAGERRLSVAGGQWQLCNLALPLYHGPPSIPIRPYNPSFCSASTCRAHSVLRLHRRWSKRASTDTVAEEAVNRGSRRTNIQKVVRQARPA